MKSILDMELIQVDWKNIISINKINDNNDVNERNEELNFLFV